MWRDEVVTYDMAHRSLPELWDTLQNADAVHGLYYLFMHVLFALFEGDVTTLRLPSVLAMTAAAAGVALLGARVAGERAGTAAGLVFPLVPLVQQYAQEGRSYAIVCALVTWSTYLLVCAVSEGTGGVADAGTRTGVDPGTGLRSETTPGARARTVPVARGASPTDRRGAGGEGWGSRAASRLGLLGAPGPARRWWLGYTLTALAACLVHEFAVLALVAHGATVVLSGSPRLVRRTWLIAAGCVVAGLAPLVLFSMGQSAQVSWILWPDPIQLLSFAVLTVVGVMCARVPVRTHGPVQLRTLAVPLLTLPPAALMLLSQLKPMYVDRYVLYYVVGFALLMGAALDWAFRPLVGGGQTRRRRTVWALVVVLAALLPAAIYLRSPQSRTDDATAVVHAVHAVAKPGDGLLFMPARRRVWTLSDPKEFRDLSDLALSRPPDSSRSLYGTEIPADRIRARMLASPRIIVLGDPSGEPVDETSREVTKRTTLRDHFERCSTQDVTGARITIYARRGGC